MNEQIERSMEAEARRIVLADAIQHPATVLPLAGAVAGAIYLLLLSPEFGGDAWAVTLLAGGGAVATLSFAWLFGFRYAEKLDERLSRLRRRQYASDLLQKKEADARRRTGLDTAFTGIGFETGRKALDELAGEYEQLQATLARQDEPASISMASVPGLADRTYRRGLSVLDDALDLMRTERAAGRQRLEKDIADLETQVDTASTAEPRGEWIEMKLVTLDSHRSRLAMIDRLRRHADRLVHQASRCEASLARARIELAEVEAGSAEARVTTVVQALEGTVRQVRDVQDELRALGF
jgi:hypothetical protein